VWGRASKLLCLRGESEDFSIRAKRGGKVPGDVIADLTLPAQNQVIKKSPNG